MNEEQQQQAFPLNWRIAQDFDPNEHMMQLKGRDYLNVQNRLLWFIRDQRALIVAGLAKVPYVVQTDLVELDRGTSWAHFKTYVRDVLGNEATMYGSESAKDFADYAEKASTKSLGRALLALGYGTAFAPEMDEGERVVDSPVERRASNHERERSSERRTNGQQQPAQQQSDGISEQQWSAINRLAAQLGVQAPTPATPAEARTAIAQLEQQFRQRASAEQQADLIVRLRTTISANKPDAEQWLLDTLGMAIRIDDLKQGRSSLTASQYQRCVAAIDTAIKEPLPA